MPVYYDNKKIIPAPLVSINKQYNRNEAGTKTGATFNIQLIGTLVSFKGSPDSDEVFWTVGGYPPDENAVFIDPDARLEAILRKQEALLNLFSNDGRTLEFQPLNGNAPLKCYPIINSINFGEGTWYDTCRYTVDCSTDRIYGLTDGELSLGSGVISASESWEISLGENEVTYNATHNISVQGRDTYGPVGLIQPGWKNAKDFATAIMGYDSNFARSIGVINVPINYNPYNHVRSESLDELGGSCNITETWVLSEFGVIEDYSVTVNSSIDDPLIKASLQGTITGLNERNNNFAVTNSRWINASGYFSSIQGNLYTRAQNMVDPGVTLNIQPLSYSVVKNNIAGNIQYTYDYDNRPSNILPYALFESIILTENYQTDQYASVPVIGRIAGPVLQDLQTKSERSRGLAVEIRVAPSSTWCLPPNIQPIIDLARPTAVQVFNTENVCTGWDYKTGKASYSVGWTFSPDGG